MQQDVSPYYTAHVKLYLILAERRTEKTCCWRTFMKHFEGGFAVFFSNKLASLSYQLYRFIDPGASGRFLNFKEFQTSSFSLMENSFIRIISTLIDTFPPPLFYHWKSTSSPEENNFIHWLHLILHSTVERVSRGATSFIFLSAGCKSTD